MLVLLDDKNDFYDILWEQKSYSGNWFKWEMIYCRGKHQNLPQGGNEIWIPTPYTKKYFFKKFGNFGLAEIMQEKHNILI